MFNLYAGISLGASAVILLLLAIKPLLKTRYRAKWRYAVWIALCMYLLIPFQKLMPASVPKIEIQVPERVVAAPAAALGEPQTADEPNAATETTAEISDETETVAADNESNIDVKKQLYNPVVEMQPTPETLAPSIRLLDAIQVLWIVGIIATLMMHGVGYARFLRGLKKQAAQTPNPEVQALFFNLCAELRIRKKIELFSFAGLPSPMLFGFFRPRVLLPVGIEGEEGLKLILKHELVHYKRHDLFVKLLVLLANAVHWFNPLVYVMRRQMDVDCELSCDEAVLAGTDNAVRTGYCETILAAMRVTSRRETSLSTYFYAGKGRMKERIARIFDSKPKKTGVIALAGVLVLLAAATSVFLLKQEPKMQEAVSYEPAPDSVEFYGTLAIPDGIDGVEDVSEADYINFYQNGVKVGGVCAYLYNYSDPDGLPIPSNAVPEGERKKLNIYSLPSVKLKLTYISPPEGVTSSEYTENHVYLMDEENQKVYDFFSAADSKVNYADQLIARWHYTGPSPNPGSGWTKLPVDWDEYNRELEKINSGAIKYSMCGLDAAIEKSGIGTHGYSETSQMLIENPYSKIYRFIMIRHYTDSRCVQYRLVRDSITPTLLLTTGYRDLLVKNVMDLPDMEEIIKSAVGNEMTSAGNITGFNIDKMEAFEKSIQNGKPAELDIINYLILSSYKRKNVWYHLTFDGKKGNCYSNVERSDGKCNQYLIATFDNMEIIDSDKHLNVNMIDGDQKWSLISLYK